MQATPNHTSRIGNSQSADEQNACRFSLIQVDGNDACSFLHRQLTCRVDDLAVGQTRFASWCDAKGRVLASMLLIRNANGLGLILPSGTCDIVINGLRPFVLRDDVRLSPNWIQSESTNNPVIHDPEKWIEQPDADQMWVRLPGQPNRHLCFRRIESNGSKPAPEATDVHGSWLSEVLAQLPWILPATSGKYLPQMLNLEALGGLNYQKGCYPGQEIIARLHYLGKVTRQLCRASSDKPLSPEMIPGAVVQQKDGPAAGEVLLAADNEAGGSDLLLVLGKVVLETQNPGLIISDQSLTVHRGGESVA